MPTDELDGAMPTARPSEPTAATSARRARVIMVQGTMSNVGKSLLVAGLCRVLAQDGLRVAPFKSQNMALNSGVTPDGLEMGRAQILQAQAAGVEPDVRMNPILLKPTSDVGSQVIVCGRSVATMRAGEYFRRKRELIPTIRRCFDELAATFDVIVIEGAGSPAEINLKSDDIVNMGLACMVGAPVLLVGDIDPGGVFAQLYGTLQLLEPQERALVRGLVINKFRGDVDILRPGLAQLEELCGVPVLGVLPHLSLDLDDEDSLSPRLAAHPARRSKAPGAESASGAPVLDVVVIRLPRLSNFTDFAPLERHPLVGVRYVDRAADVGRPDLLVLPGTKATLADLAWLRERGLDRCVRALAEQGTPIIGICGGYQMLGEELTDPCGVESPAGERAEGLGLLPAATTFAPQKHLGFTRARVAAAPQPDPGFFPCLADLPLEGYEIHMGETTPLSSALRPGASSAATPAGAPCIALRTSDSRLVGLACGNVLGTYLHGLFDTPAVVERLVDVLLARRGLPPADVAVEPAAAIRDRELDRLAAAIRTHLDLPAIYRILNEGM